MLEFVLFHEQPTQLFVDYLKSKNIEAQTSLDEEVRTIRIRDDLDEALLDEIEDKYDELMNFNHALFQAENPPTEDNYRVASIVINLKNGETTQAHVRPELLAEVIEVINEAELNELVQAIVDAVENPDGRSYCQKVRAGEVKFDDAG